MDEPGTAGAACPWGPSQPPASGRMDGSTGSNRTGSILSSMETVVLLQGVGRAGAPIPVEGCQGGMLCCSGGTCEQSF